MATQDEKVIDYIKSELSSIDYGSIVITVHDGKVTQIEKNEKKRFSQATKLGSVKK
ncbi:YezD family protein [Bacillus sp. FSL K6-3431]|uniref:YezD family protein n=1 Tax=Bacillus sp. FSL K6-3431 TaxID=2921500 RepID=UPI0030F7EA11